MKNYIFRSFLIFIFSLITVVSLGADFVTIYFHDGTHKRFFLNEVKEIRNSKYDLDKNLHADYRTQMVETKNGTYLQDISKIDSVVFSKEDVHFPKTEVEIEAMIERSHEIAVRMNQIVDSLKAIEAYDPMIITQEFSKIPDVIDAELNENNSCITLLRSDSIYHDFILDYWSIFSSLKQRNRMLSRYDQAFHPSYKYYPHINQTYKTSEHFIGENKLVKEIKEVLILAPFEDLYSDYSNSYFEELCELIRKNLDVAPHLFKGDLADITKFKGTFLDKFDLILFYTHGGQSSVGTHLLSGTSMSKNKDYWKKAVKEGVIPEIRKGTPEGYNEEFLEMSPKFLENASFNNTIVLAFACSSADRSFASPSMMSTFLEKGASYYCGFSNTSNSIAVSQFGQKGAQLSFACLSLQDAFDYLIKNDLVVDVNQNWIQYYRTYFDNVTQEEIDQFNLDLFDYEAKYDNCYLKSPFPYSLETHHNSYSVSLSWKSDLSEETLQFFNPDDEKKDFTYPEQTYKIRYDVYFNTELIASNLYDKEMMWDEMNENNTWYVVAKVVNSLTGETIATYKSEEDYFTFSYPKLTLSHNTLTLHVNTSGSIDITSGCGNYVIESSDEFVATAFIDGNTISVNALNPGDAVITVSDKVTGQTATIEVTVQAKDIPSEVIDLGLPSGTLWASYNVGATKPEEYGDYYAWGETEMKETCRWKNYSHCEGTQETCVNLGSNISGTKYDVAHAKWGGEWRLPTRDQIKELMNNCTSAWTTVSGVNGIMFTGPNGKTVFFPAAGYLGSEVLNSGSYGYYWSGDQDPKNAERAYNLSIQNGDLYCVNNYRFAGFAVRPVMSGLELSHTGTLSMLEGESETLTINSGSGSYRYEIDKNDIVSVSIKGKLLTINALKTGDATITVIDTNTDQIANIPVVVNAIPVAIDLGLPSGTKWASFNVGANKPEEYGNYYSWGETEVRDQYYFTTYSLCDGTVTSCHDIGENISGTEYDVAHVKWGGEWCMPTKDDFQELAYNCEYKETSVNGVKGLQFTGPNGQYIFLPYSGYVWNTENDKAGSEGSYWSATQTTNVNRAHEMNFKKDEVLWNCYINRFAGLTVRPVIHSTLALADLTLSSTEPITVKVDDKATIEITSGNGNYTAKSDNEDVAIARVENNATVIIKGISTGSATVTVTDTQSGQTASIEVTVTSDDIVPYLTCPDDHHPHMIDLGLPSGKKWACCNVDAISPEDYGGYYAWFETEVKDDYSWSTYIHADGTEYSFHINDIFEDTFWEQNDVAHMKWGGSWMVPSSDDFKELKKYCTYQWTSRYGIEGAKFTSKNNGNCVFFPAAGYKSGIYRYGANSHGDYWSRGATLDYDENWLYGYSFSFGSTGSVVVDTAPYEGLPVRPVWK